MTRIGIFGIGGIGGYIGMKLANYYSHKDRHEIIFIQRGEHYKAIKENGLTYKTKREITVKPDLIVDKIEDAGTLDILFICVKSRDLESSIESIKHAVHPQSIIIPVMNGVNITETIQEQKVQATVLSGCIYVSAEIEKPGTVKQTTGAGYLIFGNKSSIDEYKWVENLLAECGIKVRLTQNIEQEVWEKFLFVGSLATITSYYKTSMNLIAENHLEEWITLMEEIILIASIKSVSLNQDNIQNCISRAKILPTTTKTSMLIDIENGKKPELDIFTTYILKTAQQHNITVPCHQKMYDYLKQFA